MLLTFINKYIYILNTILQIKVLPHLIIYKAIVRGSPGGWCPRGGWCLVASSLVAGGVLPGGCHRWSGPRCLAAGGVLLGAGGVLLGAGGVLLGAGCPPWCWWWLVVSSLVAAIGGVVLGVWWLVESSPVAAIGGVVLGVWRLVVAPWQPRPHIHSRTRRRVHARLPSAAAVSLVN